MEPVVIETERLRLLTLSESDIAELVPLIGDPRVAATTLRIPHPFAENHAREFLNRPAGENELRLGIRLRGSGALIGGLGLHPYPEHKRAELGYWIGVPYWGQGYATEAARAVVKYGFEKTHLNRIFAAHFKHNPASGRVLQKIGMKYEGCMRQNILKWGNFVDVELYSILKQEFDSGLK
ncbi:MAG TPA: GNAT family protein [Terriglobales bacterium]|jgi:RimJ/RimL family protein N-acetyltransferase|nr:GNAT family protein [Terriglobales bacterium]